MTYMEVLFLVLAVIAIPIISIVYYSLLKKFNYELKGFELLLYEIAVISSIICITNVDELAFFILTIVMFAIGIYYFIRMLKKKEYISICIVISYIILSIINAIVAINICDKMHTGWCMCGILYLLIAFGVPIYLVMLNGITFIIRKVKKIENREKIKINKIFILLLFIVAMLFACCGIVIIK